MSHCVFTGCRVCYIRAYTVLELKYRFKCSRILQLIESVKKCFIPVKLINRLLSSGLLYFLILR